MQGDIRDLVGGDPARAAPGAAYQVDRTKPTSAPANAVRRLQAGPGLGKSWSVGDPGHASGIGEITHTFGSGEKVSIAVKFPGMGPKILDPRLAPIEPVSS